MLQWATQSSGSIHGATSVTAICSVVTIRWSTAVVKATARRLAHAIWVPFHQGVWGSLGKKRDSEEL